VRPEGTVNIVVMMRLVWRKGVHLIVHLIPEVGRLTPNAYSKCSHSKCVYPW